MLPKKTEKGQPATHSTWKVIWESSPAMHVNRMLVCTIFHGQDTGGMLTGPAECRFNFDIITGEQAGCVTVLCGWVQVSKWTRAGLWCLYIKLFYIK